MKNIAIPTQAILATSLLLYPVTGISQERERGQEIVPSIRNQVREQTRQPRGNSNENRERSRRAQQQAPDNNRANEAQRQLRQRAEQAAQAANRERAEAAARAQQQQLRQRTEQAARERAEAARRMAEQNAEAAQRAQQQQQLRQRTEQAARERAEAARRMAEQNAEAAQRAQQQQQLRQRTEQAARERAEAARRMAEQNADAAERAQEQLRQRTEQAAQQANREAQMAQQRLEQQARERQQNADRQRQMTQDRESATRQARERAQQLAREAERRIPQSNRSESEIQRLREQSRRLAEEAVNRSSDDDSKGKGKARNQPVPDTDIARILEGRSRPDRDSQADRDRATRLNDRNDAAQLITSILGNPRPVPSQINRRLPADRVGRTRDQRVDSVSFIIQRLLGATTYQNAPQSFDSRDRDRRRGDRDRYHHHDHYHFYFGNHRVVRYPSYNRIPPVLLACRKLGYLQVHTYNDSPYRPDVANVDPRYYSYLPAPYLSQGAYSVSYEVDPNSAVTRDDILFKQGSTAFADPLSYDLVVDIAEAIQSSALSGQRFVIEGHASAEGSYDANLNLSQRRAERIASELVAYGVDPTRIIPVGYGEGEAVHPANAAESLRALDRRVTVFRLKQ